MATIKGWFTMNGMHIPIMEGQSKAEAASKYINSKHGKDVAKLSSKTNNKNKFTDSYESAEKAADIYSFNINKNKTVQECAKDFYDKIGYNSKPNKTTESELERVAKTSKFGLLERGYRGNNKEEIQEYINQFKDGDLYIGSQRAFGSGTYFGYGNEAHSIAHRYAQQDNDNILKASIVGNAKIITSEKLNAKRDEFRAKAFEKATEINKTKGSAEANKYYTKMNNITMDDGVFAASLGYDAINVTDAKYIVVLNRGKVLVSE